MSVKNFFNVAKIAELLQSPRRRGVSVCVCVIGCFDVLCLVTLLSLQAVPSLGRECFDAVDWAAGRASSL